MNNALVIFQAAKFAERLRREAGDDVDAQVDRGLSSWRSAAAPMTSSAERQRRSSADSADGLAGFCQALFNLNEFVYRP